MNISYITWPPFLDFSIEYINALKSKSKLHVYVVLNNIFLESCILKIDKYPFTVGELVTLAQLKGLIDNYELFENYAAGCASFNFILYPDQALSLAALNTCKKLASAINATQPAVVHFDDVHPQLIGMRIFLKCKNIVSNIHEPFLHADKNSWKFHLARWSLFPIIKEFILFSAYSRKQFMEIYRTHQTVNELALIPYYFYAQIKPEVIDIPVVPNEIVLLFFGRIAPYKGVDHLLETFSRLCDSNPQLKLIIAGKGNLDVELPDNLKNQIGKRLIIINRFITNAELASLMKNADFVVCPYKTATQSGVIMTAFGFDKKVIATKVGGLHEPITEGSNGFVYPANSPEMLDEILLKIIEQRNSQEKFMVKTAHTASYNMDKLINIYERLTAS